MITPTHPSPSFSANAATASSWERHTTRTPNPAS